MNADTINTIFRAAHSIKLAAAPVSTTWRIHPCWNPAQPCATVVAPDTDAEPAAPVGRRAARDAHGGAAKMLIMRASTRCMDSWNMRGRHFVCCRRRRLRHTPGHRTQDQLSSQPHLLRTGNDPLRIFRELGEQGSLEIDADLSQLPAFDMLDPESCYLGWNLVLESMAAESTINEAFDWVRDESALEISRESTEGSRESRVESRESTPTVSLTHDSRLSTHRNGAKARTAGRPRPPPKAPPSASTSARSMSSSTWSASWSLP